MMWNGDAPDRWTQTHCTTSPWDRDTPAMCAQHPSLMLGHLPNIYTAHAIRRTASLLCDPVPTVPQRGITPVVVTMLDLSRRRERTGVYCQGPMVTRATSLPDLHSVLSWILFHGHVPGYQNQHLHVSLGQTPRAEFCTQKLVQAEKHRTMTNCAGMCAQHTARADKWCQIKRENREIH